MTQEGRLITASKPRAGLLYVDVTKCPRCGGRHENLTFWPTRGDQDHFQWMANCRSDVRIDCSPVLMSCNGDDVKIF